MMKRILILACLALASCGLEAPESWQGTANPLDQPATYTLRGPAMGRFGPGWADQSNATR